MTRRSPLPAHLHALAFALALPSACRSPIPAPTCGVLGDPTKPMQVELFYVGADQAEHDVDACGPVDVVQPPQGGEVVFVGVRATNVDGCNVAISAALRDPSNLGVIGADVRSGLKLAAIDGRPGWGETSLAGGSVKGLGYSNLANVAVCPNVGDRDVQRVAGLLDLELKDRPDHAGDAQVLVIPRCADVDPALHAFCECICSANATGPRCQNVSEWDAGTANAACPPPDGGATDAAGDRDGPSAPGDGGALDLAGGRPSDLATTASDLATPTRDLAAPPSDMTASDLSAALDGGVPADMAPPRDLASLLGDLL